MPIKQDIDILLCWQLIFLTDHGEDVYTTESSGVHNAGLASK